MDFEQQNSICNKGESEARQRRPSRGTANLSLLSREIQNAVARLKEMETALAVVESTSAKVVPPKLYSQAISTLKSGFAFTFSKGCANQIDALEVSADDYASDFSGRFREALSHKTSHSGIPFKPLSDNSFGVGPFEVRIDSASDSSLIRYAKVDVAKVPLDPSAIVASVEEQQKVLFAPSKNEGTLARDFLDAMKIALARADKRAVTLELRADLPSIFKAMELVRNDQILRGRGEKKHPYTIARFVVELKRLVQSDLNINGSQRFIPQPAVIENSRDPKKSIFVPNEIEIGFGEGMYIQALSLRSQKPLEVFTPNTEVR